MHLYMRISTYEHLHMHLYTNLPMNLYIDACQHQYDTLQDPVEEGNQNSILCVKGADDVIAELSLNRRSIVANYTPGAWLPTKQRGLSDNSAMTTSAHSTLMQRTFAEE